MPPFRDYAPASEMHLPSEAARASLSSRLSPEESHRIIAILEETMERLSFLGSITPDVMEHRDRLSRLVGGEIGRVIQEQRALEQRYEQLIIERSELRGMANKTRYREVQCEIADVSRALRESTQSLSHNLKDNPNIAGNLAKIQKDRGDLIDLLGRVCLELAEKGTFNTLTSVLEQDAATQSWKSDLIQREQEATAAVKQLEETLNGEREAFDENCVVQRTTMLELKEKLGGVRGEMGLESQVRQKEYAARVAALLRVYQQEENALEKSIGDLEKKQATEQTAHEATMTFLEKKAQQLTSVIDAWEERYAKEHGELEAKLESLNKERQEMLVTLEHLKTRKAEEQAEEDARKTEARRLEEEAANKAADELRRCQGASAIQRVFRQHLANPARVSKKDKGKGKKGGKKGKGGGKKKK